jgi:hypothetical protein
MYSSKASAKPAEVAIMKTHVEFRSPLFVPNAEDGSINFPEYWGKLVAQYLYEKLPAYGFEPKYIDSGDDWGATVVIKNDQFDLRIDCSHPEATEDLLLCCIEPHNPVERVGIFKKVETAPFIDPLADALDKILTSDPEIRDVRWWSEEEIDRMYHLL